MHHSCVQLRLASSIPESLIRFLEEGVPIISDSADLELEPPRKKHRATGTRSPLTPLSSTDSDDYLTLARVDLGIVCGESPSESYPSPSSSEKHIEEYLILLKHFEATGGTGFECRISALNGDTIFHEEVQASNIRGETIAILQKASRPLSRRKHGCDLITQRFTISGNSQVISGKDSQGNTVKARTHTFDLCFRILAPNATSLACSIGISHIDFLELYAPDLSQEARSPWSPRDLYDNVHIPPSDCADSRTLAVEGLECELYPFQSRAVQWLLQRERVLKANPDMQKPNEISRSFVRTIDADGRQCFASPFLGIVTTHNRLPLEIAPDMRGGILAEEMGLGKTVEMISLICLNKRILSENRAPDGQLPPTSATLIITPPAILQQWKDELQTLAPALSVLIYGGVRHEAGKSDHVELLAKCTHHDVVLTTYNVLAKEIHYAEIRDRNLRHQKRYERRLSPLTQTQWWRVVLDEAQMVESGVSNAAKVAKLIPREIGWCVSGTPVKKDARDLFGLLDFLKYRPYCDLPPQAWDRLVTHHKAEFKQIFKTIALRHTKDQIKEDIRLPPQKRVVISVPFTPIEEQHYLSMFKQMSDECGLNFDGSPATDDWDPNSPVVIEKMRNWLVRLRQTCLHPEVGSKNRRALGNGKGPLRTVKEVLEVMIEQTDTAARSEERALLLSQIRRGQILEHAELSEEALQIWLLTLNAAASVVQDCRDQLRAEIDRLGLSEDVNLTSESDEMETDAGTQTALCRQRLRAAVEVEHMCTFFIANAYFQIKTNEEITKAGSDEFVALEKMEESTYETAKLLRKELLSISHRKASAFINRIHDRIKDNKMTQIPKLQSVTIGGGGIESRTYFDRLDGLITLMEKQKMQLNDWREKTSNLLLLPLVDEEVADLQGDEYEISTKQQDEVYVYVDALRALIADRHFLITGQRNELIKHEMDIALKQAMQGQGHSPQLLRELLSIRSDLEPPEDLDSVRGMTIDLRELKTTLRAATERGNSRAAAELIMVQDTLTTLRQIMAEQTRAITGLEREIELFKDTMNLRLEYYRQLQHISDTVAPFEEEMTEEIRNAALAEKKTSELQTQARIATLKSKSRYLVHLRDEASNVYSQKMCIICQQPFERGILTSCGHSYCVECLRLWWGAHRNCPTCKKHLSRNDFHQITYKPQELTMEEEPQTGESEVSVTQRTRDATIYSGIRDTLLNQIKNIDIEGSFGTKIDTLARHILWIREHDAGAKSIVFSQYRDFLDVLARAFSQFKIGFTGIDRKDGIQKFKSDPSLECFFLHAKAQSSGLNLVNATHVFLCEPLINTAIELQAIARVHRIGQHQPTTVWMYLVEGTVEKSIYDISVTRRLAHMGHNENEDKVSETQSLEHKIEAANTLELEETPLAKLLEKGFSGGELVGKEDLWHCLFRQKPGQTGRASRETERELARHVGAEAGESRFSEDGPSHESDL